MLTKKLSAVIALVLLVAAITLVTTTGAFAQSSKDRPFEALMVGTTAPDGSGGFDMQATHLGKSTGVGGLNLGEPDEAGCLPLIDGGFTWTAANGDQVNTTISGEDFSACVVGGDETSIVINASLTEVINGGTGRFEDATGEVRVEVHQIVSLLDGTSTFTGTKSGVINY